MRILFTGAGTGGHFFPLLAVVREIKQRAEDNQILGLELFFMGPETPWEELLIEEEVGIVHIQGGKIRRYFSLLNIVDLFRIGLGIIQALWKMFFLVPDVIFSKGGHGAFATVLAAVIFRIPLMIHESDSVPGIVNKFSARFATRIGVGFKGAYTYFPQEKTALTGVPIRKRILGGNKDEAKENFGVFSNVPVVGIIGASQGSQRINDAVMGILKELTNEFDVLHQTGEKNFEEVTGESRVILEFNHHERYHPFGFLKETDIRDFYMASDIIVSRAGASSIFEVAAWGKPSIMIPLGGSAQDHQEKNAYEYAAAGACIVIQEENLTPHLLFSEIKKLLSDPERIRAMASAAQRFARIDATEIVADEILKLGAH